MTRTCMLVLTTLALGSATLTAQSPMFRANPAHTGVYDSPAPALTTLAWKFKTNGPVLSTPAIDNGIAYVGSTDYHLYAVRVADGTEVWKYRSGLGIQSSPAVAGGLVYFNSRDGNVYALTAASGELAWKFATAGERRFTAPGMHGIQPATEMVADPFDVFLSSPVVVDGTVYVGSGDHHVYALDAVTGALRWKFQTGNVVHATPAVANGTVYIGSWDRHLYALDARTGAERWRFQTGDDQKIYNQIGIASSAAVVDGVVLFGCRDGHFYAVDAATGARKWAENNRGGWVIASPAVRGGVVYFPTSDGTQFKAIDIATGALKWRTVNRNVSFSSPAIAGDTVYFGTHDGILNALDLATGAPKAEFQTDGHKAHRAQFIDDAGKIITRSIYRDFTIDAAFAGLERQFLLGSVLSSPVVAGGVVYFGSTDGHLYAVR